MTTLSVGQIIPAIRTGNIHGTEISIPDSNLITHLQFRRFAGCPACNLHLQSFSRRMNRVITTIPSEAMEALVNYPWPGNIRELQNLIERAVILSPAAVLRVPVAELKAVAKAASPSSASLEAVAREHILRALKDAHGVIGGPNGAAARLGMKRTTLQSRMQKFGIAYNP